MHPIYAFGTETQKEKYLPKLGVFLCGSCYALYVYIASGLTAKGEIIGCFVSICCDHSDAKTGLNSG